jgi:hypothetical protein
MAAPLSPQDQKTQRMVREAENGMEDLIRYIRPALKNIHRREIDLDKAVKAMKQTLKFMDKTEAVVKVQGSPVYKQLSAPTQLQLDWMHGLASEILSVQVRLTQAKKQMLFDPDEKFKLLLKTIKDIFALMPNAPRGMLALIKEIQKGVDPKSPEHALIAILPMSLLLFFVQDSILRGLDRKPKDA